MARMEQQLDRVDRSIAIFEKLIQKVSSLTKVRQLEKTLVNLRDVRRTMQRLDKTDPKDRKKFWQLSRRTVSLAARLARRISSS